MIWGLAAPGHREEEAILTSFSCTWTHITEIYNICLEMKGVLIWRWESACPKFQLQLYWILRRLRNSAYLRTDMPVWRSQENLRRKIKELRMGKIRRMTWHRASSKHCDMPTSISIHTTKCDETESELRKQLASNQVAVRTDPDAPQNRHRQQHTKSPVAGSTELANPTSSVSSISSRLL